MPGFSILIILNKLARIARWSIAVSKLAMPFGSNTANGHGGLPEYSFLMKVIQIDEREKKPVIVRFFACDQNSDL